ncbi:hypothetical protein Hs30E_02330 [Lactococcus hodotermopsidis]|uniref:Uncharacterized protein n=1 Tax=Pseudolactococcus hodotermopsidis TaxID=2709157 RepID=A0A6A0B8N0_9LACT|nr:hypothetical protein [Lactococcus hodotermopsidis]GFH41682.1 hypothetical protein Hs30E_02330 [Lactococcus hodotermopsidis]
MLKYLFKKNIKTDSDYKKNLLLTCLNVVMLEMMFVIFAIMSTGERQRGVWGGVVGSGSFLIGYVIWIIRLLLSPKRLRAARLRCTDERRKLLEQKVYTHIGIFMMSLLIILSLVSLLWQPVVLEPVPMIVLLYLILGYRIIRLRK